MVNQCDVVVIGLGPGGEAAAAELARAGLDVVGVDEGLAGAADVRPDWKPVHARVRDEATDDWDDTVAVKRLEDAGVRFVRGHGRLVAPRTVEVDGNTYEAAKGVVLNTGTRPATPPIEGLADTPFWTNRDILRTDSLPGTLGVIGGRPIGAELAQAVARFG